MPKMLTDFKKGLHGCPGQLVDDDESSQDFEKGMKAWKDILDRMIFCFREMNEETCSMKNEYEDEYHEQLHKPNEGKSVRDWFTPCGEDEHGEKLYHWNTRNVEPELDKKYRQRMHEINDYKEKMKNEGFELFCKYFDNLWD